MSTQFKYFGTDGIRGKVGEYPITAEFMLRLGWSAGRVLAPDGGTILIGKDTRVSGYMFEAALEAGLSAAGVNVILLGPMPTPAVAYLTRTFRAEAGIMISASHNPYYDNGIKFFTITGEKLSDELSLAIEAEMHKEFTTVESNRLGRAKRASDAAGRYIEFCKRTIPYQTEFRGLRVVIDCANGATYHIAPHVFRELGVSEIIEINNRPNGVNINLDCGATHLVSLQEKVLEMNADVGIAFDGDGDRLMMVDHEGKIVDGDELLFILACAYREEGLLKEGVVGTVMTNFGIELAFRKSGIPFHRAPVGDRYVVEAMTERGWNLGGESSGHIVFSNLTTTGDGIISAVQLLNVMQSRKKSLHELAAGLEKVPQKIINVKTKTRCGDPLQVPIIAQAVIRAQEILNDHGRVLLRCSGTEPLIRVMVEGFDANMVQKISDDLAKVVQDAQT